MNEMPDGAADQGVPDYIYKIDGDYGPQDHIPPEAIVGCWLADTNGEPMGEFISNPNFRPAPARSSLLGSLPTDAR
jgi:hypothetical protein